jgi:hypothetical protein
VTAIEDLPCGNLVMIFGISKYLKKTATITNVD